MKCHEVDYQLIGDDLQLVEVELDPGESVIAEAGAMCYMEDDIKFEAKMGDGSDADQGMFGKLLGAGKRMMTGESIFITHFTNTGSGKRIVSFASPYPGKIIAANLDSADFRDADLTDTLWISSNVANAAFSGAEMAGAKSTAVAWMTAAELPAELPKPLVTSPRWAPFAILGLVGTALAFLLFRRRRKSAYLTLENGE